MPTYQYACTDAECGNQFELVQSFTDPAASTCPVCGGPVRKVFSAVGVVFKGSGFYRTDSREAARKAKSASNGSSTKESTKSTTESGGTSTKSDSSSSASTSSGSSSSDSSSSGSKSSGSNSGSSSSSAATAASA